MCLHTQTLRASAHPNTVCVSVCALADNKQLDFASFLDVLHDHSKVENCQKELEAALVAQDQSRSGYVSAADIRQILTSLGEKLSRNEGEMKLLALP